VTDQTERRDLRVTGHQHRPKSRPGPFNHHPQHCFDSPRRDDRDHEHVTRYASLTPSDIARRRRPWRRSARRRRRYSPRLAMTFDVVAVFATCSITPPSRGSPRQTSTSIRDDHHRLAVRILGRSVIRRGPTAPPWLDYPVLMMSCYVRCDLFRRVNRPGHSGAFVIPRCRCLPHRKRSAVRPAPLDVPARGTFSERTTARPPLPPSKAAMCCRPLSIASGVTFIHAPHATTAETFPVSSSDGLLN